MVPFAGYSMPLSYGDVGAGEEDARDFLNEITPDFVYVVQSPATTTYERK